MQKMNWKIWVLKDYFSPINQYINYPKHIKVEKPFIEIVAWYNKDVKI